MSLTLFAHLPKQSSAMAQFAHSNTTISRTDFSTKDASSAAAAASADASASASASAAVEYDLTSQLALFLDRHMLLLLVEALQDKKVYELKTIKRLLYELAEKTFMVDFAAQQYKEIHDGKEIETQALERKRQSVLAELVNMQEKVGTIMPLLDEETVNKLRANHKWTLDELVTTYGVTTENVEALFRLAKATYETGNYQTAANLLLWFRLIAPTGPKTDDGPDWDELRFGAIWGKVAAEIVLQNWDVALADLNMLKEAIDSRIWVPHEQQLQQRAWLAHWSLFVFFNLPQEGLSAMLDFLMSDKLLAAICTVSPHLLRYLGVAGVLNRRKRNALNDVARTIASERQIYKDPITEFIQSTVTDFNFDAAHTQLKGIEKLVTVDYFLSGALGTLFIQNAKFLLFETYCRIHKTIDVQTLAHRLDVPSGEEEATLVEFIRSARVDAKIDSKNNQIVVNTQFPNIYQQVIDKTKSIAYRSSLLVQAIEKKAAS